MEEREFDKKIKEKVQGHQPPFSESTWSRLEQRLDAVTPVPVPWYVKWGGWLFGSAMLLLTLVNLGIFWQTRQEKVSIAQMLQQEETSSTPLYLYDTVYIRDTVRESILDTVYIVEDAGGTGISKSPTVSYLRGLGSGIAGINDRDKGQISSPLQARYTNKFYNPSAISNLQGYSPGLDTSPWAFRPMVGVGQQSNASQPQQALDFLASTFSDMHDSLSLLQREVRGGYTYTMYDELEERQAAQQENPLQFRLGIAAGFAIPDPDIGRRFLTPSQDFSIELFRKKRDNTRLMTGLTHYRLSYLLEGVRQQERYTQEELARYPGISEMENLPNTINVENQLIHIPLQLRQYFPLNYDWRLMAGLGASLDILLRQEFRYQFVDISGGEVLEYEQINRFEDARTYFGSLKGTLGLEYSFAKKWSGQTSINYRYGMSPIGIEQRSMDVLHFNLGLWWKVR
ncbi:hypothetical protein WJR50_14065 [Catalinimonas sp. 4WD22]|uniref:hypothetical protein n=1 Tax=Catalinimonas locisalis TaxID=3133978 RepID=UPI003100C2A5